MAKKKKPVLPEAGSAFAFLLEDGRYGVCRVLLDASSQQARQWGGPAILAACADWIGNEVPTAERPELRSILFLSHHSWKHEPNVIWLDEEIPPEFIPIGTIPPSPQELELDRGAFGSWKSLTGQPLLQWKWDHDREAALADGVRQKALVDESFRQAEQEWREYLSRVKLVDLQRHQFFPNWEEYPPPAMIAASRRVMSDTVARLIGVGPNASREAKMAILRECIESFNRLDAETSFIETDEREDICKEFEVIVHACGLGAYEDLADNWREW